MNVGNAQTNFAKAQGLAGGWGFVTNSNIGVHRDTNPPPPTSPVTPPMRPFGISGRLLRLSGEVELDTVGSMGSGINLDTVLGVFTGTSLTTLNQVAANDDLYPINKSIPSPADSHGYRGLQ